MERVYSKQKSKSIVVISFPMGSKIVVNALMDNLIKILIQICEKIFVISSNLDKTTKNPNVIFLDQKLSLHLQNEFHLQILSLIVQIFKVIIIEIKISLSLIHISRNIHTVVFYHGGVYLFPLVLLSKLLKKRVIYLAFGTGSHTDYQNLQTISPYMKILKVIIINIEKLNFKFSDKIVIQTPSIIHFFKLEQYKEKIICNGSRFIDLDVFYYGYPPTQRNDIIGYIGRLNEGKGIQKFFDAIDLILNVKRDVTFFIGGSGPLYMSLKNKIGSSTNQRNIQMSGWIPHTEISEYLRRIKILVLPSESEGLPTIILEAMAVGTIVLVTPVGGIPDVIKDGENGFILKENTPDCIADSINKILGNPFLNQIAYNARQSVETNFSINKAIERYQRILN